MQKTKSKYSQAASLICIVLMLSLIAYLVVFWNRFPNSIPAHYNASGAVDRWGGKGELLILPAICAVLFTILTVVEHFPNSWNTGVTVTEENRERVYQIIKNLLGTVKLTFVAVFTYLTVTSSLAMVLPIWFLPVMLLIIFCPILYFIIKLNKAK